jgi:hypothetical protein
MRHAPLPIYGVGSARADTTAAIIAVTTAVVTTAATTVATTAATTVDTTAATIADITAVAITADLLGDQAQATSLVALRPPTPAAYSLALAATALALTATAAIILASAANFPVTPATACRFFRGGREKREKTNEIVTRVRIISINTFINNYNYARTFCDYIEP